MVIFKVICDTNCFQLPVCNVRKPILPPPPPTNHCYHVIVNSVTWPHTILVHVMCWYGVVVVYISICVVCTVCTQYWCPVTISFTISQYEPTLSSRLCAGSCTRVLEGIQVFVVSTFCDRNHFITFCDNMFMMGCQVLIVLHVIQQCYHLIRLFETRIVQSSNDSIQILSWYFLQLFIAARVLKIC